MIETLQPAQADFLRDESRRTGQAEHMAFPRTEAEVLTILADARRHGYLLHAWTVNDPERMARYMDLGVNDISTDVPAEAVRVRAGRAALGDVELLLARLHSWFRR